MVKKNWQEEGRGGKMGNEAKERLYGSRRGKMGRREGGRKS